MNQRNCKKCGRVFIYVSGYPLCKECKAKDENEYITIREYIKNHPGVKIEEVSEALHISSLQVLRYLREERLEITQGSEQYLRCEFCGNIIKTGRFCDQCKIQINKELNKQPVRTLGDNYYYDEEEEKKIQKLKSSLKKDNDKY